MKHLALFLVVISITNVIFAILDHNLAAALGWGCAALNAGSMYFIDRARDSWREAATGGVR